MANQGFYYVRHGETEWNSNSLCQGGQDIKLSCKGRDDAAKLRFFFQNKKIRKIFSSPLQRARETANIIANHSLEVKILDGLKERIFGLFEGWPNNLMYAVEEMEKSRSFDSEYFYESFKIESVKIIMSRVEAALLEIKKNLDNPLLIVSHGRIFNFICEHLQVTGIKQIKHNQIIYFYIKKGSWAYEIHEI
ncbi:MAG: histidine phosphatase family protein [Gammaproteobacteria bacterium]